MASKKVLKKQATIDQQQRDDITGEELSPNLSLVDTDRRTPKLEGGAYTTDNTRALTPRSHMQRHGNLRERAEQLEVLKALFDDRVQTMKLQLKINNQLLAYERRTDHAHPETAQFLRDSLKPIVDRLTRIDKELAKAIKHYDDPVSQTALKVKGLGPVTVAALAVYIDLNKADTPSALWQYVGLDRPSHQRYEKNAEQQARREARGPGYYNSTDSVPTGWGGNKVLRTVLWNTACVMVKLPSSPYRSVYDRTKLRLSNSSKLTKSRTTAGALVEVAWSETKPGHRHGAALRAVMKHVLADYWWVGRTLMNLRTVPLYVQEKLGHTHIISPQERGWQV